ncbi:MAG: hypothetical protein HFI71_02725 [Lachnospiraceae bacterium]|nr:hypothetical protein [Lachnospiraceae bacterium]
MEGDLVAFKEELLASIQSNMKLTKSFLKRVYCYGVTDASFPDQAILALEEAGCSRARQYYEDWVAAYEAAYRVEIKEVAAWYLKECEKNWEKRRKEGENARWKEIYSVNSVQSSYLQQQKEKLTELKNKIQTLN